MLRLFTVRSVLIAAALALVIQLQRPCAAQEVLDGIAAVVNDDVITFSQVRELVGSKEKSLRESLKGNDLIEKIKEVRLQAINDLVDRQLILQEFKKNKFSIPEHYIEDRISTITREDFGNDRSAFVRTLAAQGYTLDRFKQLEIDKMIVQAMRGQMIKGDTSVPESKVTAYYEAHRAEYTTEEQVKLRMITLRNSEKGESRRKMTEEIRQKISEGAEFQGLAKMYSEDSNQETGGDWGWVTRKTLNETLTKAAFALKPGEVSPVIEMGNSYYLLTIDAKKGAATKPLAELHDEIQKRLIQEERQKRQQEGVAKLRKKAYIKFF